jgi:hypothetical protein
VDSWTQAEPVNYIFYFGSGTLAANAYFPFLEALIGLFIACIVWFYVPIWLRTREGLPFEKAFLQIPPE